MSLIVRVGVQVDEIGVLLAVERGEERKMGKAVNGGRYADMEFPPYVFRDYPKWVKLNSGKRVIAESASHALKLIAEDASVAEPNPLQTEKVSLAQQVADLRAKLAEHGIEESAPEPIAEELPPLNGPKAKPTEGKFSA